MKTKNPAYWRREHTQRRRERVGTRYPPPTPPSYSRPMEGPRIDEVRIELPGGMVSIPWSSRDALLDQLQKREAIVDVPDLLDAFQAVSTSRPVHLTDPQKLALRKVITFWANELGSSYDNLPEGIHDLRNALHVDLPIDDDEVAAQESPD